MGPVTSGSFRAMNKDGDWSEVEHLVGMPEVHKAGFWGQRRIVARDELLRQNNSDSDMR